MSRPVEVGTLKIGQHIIINDVPCRIVEYEKSKPGKHGSAKARIVGIGIFDGAKRSIVCPVDARVDVPIIDKRSGQVVSIAGGQLQLMDLETYDVFYVPMPQEDEVKARLSPGVEVEYWDVSGQRRVMRVKGQA
ncbi:MAG: translation initiation factor IF-5A [Candidatus Bathyarchaeia archaeon]